jgi:hypothetical protein
MGRNCRKKGSLEQDNVKGMLSLSVAVSSKAILRLLLVVTVVLIIRVTVLTAAVVK